MVNQGYRSVGRALRCTWTKESTNIGFAKKQHLQQSVSGTNDRFCISVQETHRKKQEGLLQHRPQIAKACKRYFRAAPCIGSSSNSFTQYSVACLHYAHGQRQHRHPAPAPNLHHTHNEHQEAGSTLPAPSTGTPAHSTTRAQAPGTLFPPRAQPADSTQHQHPAPAPCLHHARSQLTVHHAHPAPSNGAQSNLSRKRARATHCYLK